MIYSNIMEMQYLWMLLHKNVGKTFKFRILMDFKKESSENGYIHSEIQPDNFFRLNRTNHTNIAFLSNYSCLKNKT